MIKKHMYNINIFNKHIEIHWYMFHSSHTKLYKTYLFGKTGVSLSEPISTQRDASA